MLYYLFECPKCGEKETFTGKRRIDLLRKKESIKCWNCYHSAPFSEYRIVGEHDDAYNILRLEDREFWETRFCDLPSLEEVSHCEVKTEDLEDWQVDLIEEFEEPHSNWVTPDGHYEDALSWLKRHKWGWVKYGVWADHFKLKRLYHGAYKTWRQFCEKELHQSHWYVDKIIKAARVIKDLICAGFKVLPQNEDQCRPFTKFWGKKLIENWAMIVDAVEPHLITSDLIKSRFCSREPRDEKWLKVDGQVWEEFEYKACSRGLDPKQIIEDYLDDWEATEDEETTDKLDYNDIENVPIKKLEVWPAD